MYVYVVLRECDFVAKDFTIIYICRFGETAPEHSSTRPVHATHMDVSSVGAEVSRTDLTTAANTNSKLAVTLCVIMYLVNTNVCFIQDIALSMFHSQLVHWTGISI